MAIRVLLVDDVPEERFVLSTALRFRPHLEVVGEAATGSQAVALVADLAPDIVVLDLGLPDLAGREVLTRIRERTPATKVVVYSGTDPERSGGVQHQADGYVVKDSQFGYLISLLETLGSAPTAEACLDLPAEVTSPRLARTFTRTTLHQWGMDQKIDDARAIVSELVTNAVVHAATACRLRLALTMFAIRIEVTDHGRGTPEPHTDSHAHGLHIVEALTASWGVQPSDAGAKLVWAELLR